MIDTGLSLYHEAYRMGGCCGTHTSINATPAAAEDGATFFSHFLSFSLIFSHFLSFSF